MTPCAEGVLAFAATSHHGYLSLIRSDSPTSLSPECTLLSVYEWSRQAQYATLLNDSVIVLSTTFELEVCEMGRTCPHADTHAHSLFDEQVWTRWLPESVDVCVDALPRAMKLRFRSHDPVLLSVQHLPLRTPFAFAVAGDGDVIIAPLQVAASPPACHH